MQKPTRGRIFILSLVASSTLSTAIATILQTSTRNEFSTLRSTIAHALSDAANNLSGFFPFWITFFVVLLTLSCVSYLTFFYNSSSQSGAILSKDGILLFDREQHIAINVATLKSILATLAKETSEGRANELLFRAGELAGKRFGGAFKEIYINQIEPQEGKLWAKLNDNDKLDAWERYDATVGWGQINAHKYDSTSIVDVVFRHPTLYEGTGGELFSWLLAGYSKEVVAALLGRNTHFNPTSGFVRDEGILRLQYTY